VLEIFHFLWLHLYPDLKEHTLQTFTESFKRPNGKSLRPAGAERRERLTTFLNGLLILAFTGFYDF